MLLHTLKLKEEVNKINPNSKFILFILNDSLDNLEYITNELRNSDTIILDLNSINIDRENFINKLTSSDGSLNTPSGEEMDLIAKKMIEKLKEK